MPFEDDIRETEPQPPSPRARILAALDVLNADELEVIAVVCERVAGQGRSTYGPLELDTDARDFRNEAMEELSDALVYSACAVVKGRRRPR